MTSQGETSERRLTYGLIFAICMQLAAAFIWAGSMAERLNALERAAPTSQEDHVLLARLETRVEAIGDQLDRIEARLEADE